MLATGAVAGAVSGAQIDKQREQQAQQELDDSLDALRQDHDAYVVSYSRLYPKLLFPNNTLFMVPWEAALTPRAP